MRVLAPAKINLHLRVGPQSADGFHPLLTWMCTVGLFDTLELRLGGESSSLTCDDASIPTDERNLVMRAASLMEVVYAKGQAPTGRPPPVAMQLSKRIPAGGGLGGGSSDGARTVLGLNHLWGIHGCAEELHDIGALLGSDVPFFFHGPSSVCTGRGERVRPIAPPAPKWALLLLPNFPMPTPDVYRTFDAMKLGSDESVTVEPDWDAWTKLSAVELLPRLANDLEAPAFALMPKLSEVRADFEQRLGRPVRMSGSGSTLFTLYDTHAEADAAAVLLYRSSVAARLVELAPVVRDDLNENLLR